MKKVKRILSAVLCLCMIASFMPIGAPSAQAADSITYKFDRFDWNTPLTGYTYDFTKQDWRYHSYSESLWPDPDFTVSNGNFTAITGGLQFDLEGGRWVAMGIKVPASGVYSASGTYAGFWKSGVNEYYIIPAAGATSEAAIAAQLTEDNLIGSKDEMTESWSTKNAITFSDVTIPEAGEYLLVIKGGKANDKYNYWWNFFETLVLTKKSEYVAPGDFEPVAKTYKFDRFDWNTPLTGYTYDFTNGDWRYHSYSESLWSDPDFTVSEGNFTAITGGLQFDLQGERWVAMAIKVPASGIYLANGTYAGFWRSGINEYYIIPAAGATSEAAIAAQLTEDNLIGSKDEYLGSWTANQAVTFSDVTIPEAGEYLLVIKGSGETSADENYWSFFEKLTLTKKANYVAPEVTVSANFGEHYAYMTKLGNKCFLTVVGGIKDIAGYSEVGFEVSVNGEVAQAKSSKNVYETINYNGAAIDTSKIGADVEYLFYETFEMSAAEFASVTDLSFKAYAVGVEGNEYGAEYALPLN